MASPAPLEDHGGDLYMGDVILHLDQGGQIKRDLLQDSQPDASTSSDASRKLNVFLVPFHVTVRLVSSARFGLHSRIFLSSTTWFKLATDLGSSCYYNRSWEWCQEGTKTEWEAQTYYAKQTNAHIGNVSEQRRGLNVVHRVEPCCKKRGQIKAVWVILQLEYATWEGEEPSAGVQHLSFWGDFKRTWFSCPTTKTAKKGPTGSRLKVLGRIVFFFVKRLEISDFLIFGGREVTEYL